MGPKKTTRLENLRGSGKINMTDEELIYFSMGPWDMEAGDAETNLHRGQRGLLISDLDVPPHVPEEVREALERTRQTHSY